MGSIDVSIWWCVACFAPALLLSLVCVEQAEVIEMQRQDIKQLEDQVKHGSIKFKRGGCHHERGV